MSWYLKEARKLASENGYDPKRLSLANDGVHKLVYCDPEGKPHYFGAVGYGDYIIYKQLEKQGKIESGTAEERRNAYHVRASKTKGNWRSNSYSPNMLSLKINWGFKDGKKLTGSGIWKELGRTRVRELMIDAENDYDSSIPDEIVYSIERYTNEYFNELDYINRNRAFYSNTAIINKKNACFQKLDELVRFCLEKYFNRTFSSESSVGFE